MKGIIINYFVFGSLLFFLGFCTPDEKTTYSEKNNSAVRKSQRLPQNSCFTKDSILLSYEFRNDQVKATIQTAFIRLLLPDKNQIVYNEGRVLKIYNVARNRISTITDFLPESQLFSEIIWFKKSKSLGWIEINESKKQCIFRLIHNGNKKKYQIPDLSYELEKNCNMKVFTQLLLATNERSLDYLSSDNNYSFKTLYFEMDHLSKPRNVVVTGSIHGGLPIYEILDNNSNKVILPVIVEKNIRTSEIHPVLMPNHDGVIYSDSASSNLLIKKYDFIDKRNSVLFKLPKERYGISKIIWSPKGDKLALVDVNRESYNEETRLYVFDINKNTLITQDIGINYNCKAFCYPKANEDFWFRNNNSIGYIRTTGKRDSSLVIIK